MRGCLIVSRSSGSTTFSFDLSGALTDRTLLLGPYSIIAFEFTFSSRETSDPLGKYTTLLERFDSRPKDLCPESQPSLSYQLYTKILAQPCRAEKIPSQLQQQHQTPARLYLYEAAIRKELQIATPTRRTATQAWLPPTKPHPPATIPAQAKKTKTKTKNPNLPSQPSQRAANPISPPA